MRLYLFSLVTTATLFGFQLGTAFPANSYSPSTIILTGGILLTLYLLAPTKQ